MTAAGKKVKYFCTATICRADPAFRSSGRREDGAESAQPTKQERQAPERLDHAENL